MIDTLSVSQGALIASIVVVDAIAAYAFTFIVAWLLQIMHVFVTRIVGAIREQNVQYELKWRGGSNMVGAFIFLILVHTVLIRLL